MNTRQCASKDVCLEDDGLEGPTSIGKENKCQRGRWALKGVDCKIHIGWGGERNIVYKGVKTSCLKTLRENSKRTIFASVGLLFLVEQEELTNDILFESLHIFTSI